MREKKQLQQGVPCFVLDPSDSKAADIDDVSLAVNTAVVDYKPSVLGQSGHFHSLNQNSTVSVAEIPGA